MMSFSSFSFIFVSLLFVTAFAQVDWVYSSSYASEYVEYLTGSTDDKGDGEGPSFHSWQSDLLITEGECSSSTEDAPSWNVGENVCNGTSYLSCMPAWPGIIQFKDRTPKDAEAISLQFYLFGSFGCGTTDGDVNYLLNGVCNIISYLTIGKVTVNKEDTGFESFVFQEFSHCGCGLDVDRFMLPQISLNSTDVPWYETYEAGDWNTLAIVSNPGVEICLCGVTVFGSYYGEGDPLSLSSSSRSGTGWLWAAATLTSLILAAILVAGIMVVYSRKKKIADEADAFDVEFD